MSKQKNYRKVREENFRDKSMMKALLLAYIKKYTGSMLREFCIEKCWKCYRSATNMWSQQQRS